MNQQREEERIKELFQQLKQDDERRAPSFASMLERAAPRGEKAGWGWPIPRIAMAPIALILVLMTLAGGWFVFFRQSANEQIAHPQAPPEAGISPLPHSDPPPLIASSENKPPKVVRRRRAPAQPLPFEAMISEWRSPTDFLLKTSEGRWMKEVPRLGVPRLEIKPFVIEQNDEMEEL